MSIRQTLTILCFAVFLQPLAGASTYNTFNMPGSCSPSGTATGINRWGSVTGFYQPCGGGTIQGFLYPSTGLITTILVSGSWGTYPMSISGAGSVVGYYVEPNGSYHGFLRNPKIVTIDVPGAGTINDQGTKALSINEAGEIAGIYFDSNSVEHGFIRDTQGSYTSFDVPGADEVTGAWLNESGQIAGNYTIGLVSHGYIMQTDGTITTFDPPESTSTYVAGINSSGEMAGYYMVGEAIDGFTSDQYGNITTFNVSGLAYTAGIEDNGNVVGAYKSAARYHGWKETDAGDLTYFSDPAAAGGYGTLPACVSGNSKVAGSYYDSSGNPHNFVMTN
jgi:hypothetical protein